MSSTLPPLHFNEAFLSWFRERTEAAWSGYPAITLNTYPRLEVYDWQQGTHWLPGLTEAEITAVEKRWNVPFPPDYRLFLSRLHAPDRLLAGVFKNDDGTLELDYDHSFFNWQADERVIQGCSDVLVDGLLWKKPEEVKRAERPHLQKVVQAAPKLIPINGNRYLLAEPCQEGNPVLSIYGRDMIVFAANFRDYLIRELLNVIDKEQYDRVNDMGYDESMVELSERYGVTPLKIENYFDIPFWGEGLEANTHTR